MNVPFDGGGKRPDSPHYVQADLPCIIWSLAEGYEWQYELAYLAAELGGSGLWFDSRDYVLRPCFFVGKPSDVASSTVIFKKLKASLDELVAQVRLPDWTYLGVDGRVVEDFRNRTRSGIILGWRNSDDFSKIRGRAKSKERHLAVEGWLRETKAK
jgi:hypothetical protein